VSPIVTYVMLVLAGELFLTAPQRRNRMSLRKADLEPIASASAADQQAGKEPRPRFAPDIRSRAVLRNGPLSSARRHHCAPWFDRRN